MPIAGGPFLVAAFFCDKFLREADGVLSAIRIVDRWNVTGPTETMQPAILQTNLLILLKSGLYHGSAQLLLTPISPANERLPTVTFPILFEGTEENGSGIAIPMAFPAQETGVYWFEIRLQGQALQSSMITAVPMRVTYLQTFDPMLGRPNQNNPGL
jgi:hypothetical protein